MKIKYADIMRPQILAIAPFTTWIRLTYTVYPKTRAELDVANVCSVVDKFFCDVFVSEGKIPDDNYKFLKEIDYRYGSVDKLNPRVEIKIEGI